MQPAGRDFPQGKTCRAAAKISGFRVYQDQVAAGKAAFPERKKSGAAGGYCPGKSFSLTSG